MERNIKQYPNKSVKSCQVYSLNEDKNLEIQEDDF